MKKVNKEVPVTINYNNQYCHGSLEMDFILEGMLKKGHFVLAPALEINDENPDDRSILSVSLIPGDSWVDKTKQ